MRSLDCIDNRRAYLREKLEHFKYLNETTRDSLDPFYARVAQHVINDVVELMKNSDKEQSVEVVEFVGRTKSRTKFRRQKLAPAYVASHVSSSTQYDTRDFTS